MRLFRQLLSRPAARPDPRLRCCCGAAVPASAHDAAESTSPASGATVPAPPEKVSVTFNRNPAGLGSQILVTDAAGNKLGRRQRGDRGQRRLAEAQAGRARRRLHRAVADRQLGLPPHRGHLHLHRHGRSAGFDGGRCGSCGPYAEHRPAGCHETPAPVPNAAEPFPWSIVIFVGTAVGILVALALMAKRRLTADDGTAARGGRRLAAGLSQANAVRVRPAGSAAGKPRRMDLGGDRLAHHLGLAQDFLRRGGDQLAHAHQIHAQCVHGGHQVLPGRHAEFGRACAATGCGRSGSAPGGRPSVRRPACGRPIAGWGSRRRRRRGGPAAGPGGCCGRRACGWRRSSAGGAGSRCVP